MSDAPVLLVTGGSRGIGAAVSVMAAAKGWRVAVNYAANREAADKVVAEIKAAGGEAIAVQADVGNAAEIVSMFQAVDKHFGRLDGLVNNAGIVDMPQRIDEMSVERIERMMRINVTGVDPVRGRSRAPHVDETWWQGWFNRQHLLHGGEDRLAGSVCRLRGL